jgi:glycosyltransferase involved in cell wall biosynthesis
MKLLLLSGYFPNSADTVRGTFNLQQAKALARHCEVRVVAPIQWFPVKLWHGAGPSNAPHFEEVGGLPTWHPRYVLTPGVARVTYAAQMAAAILPLLARIREEYPYDVLLATWAFPEVVVGAMASRLLNVPLLAKVHGSDINVQATFPARRRQIQWAMARAHRILAVSDALREKLVELGVPDEKVMVHHNGVDGERFRLRDRQEIRRQLGLDPTAKHLVYVGYLNESKALHILVEALARLRSEGRLDFTTHLIGCGPLRDELTALSVARGLQDVLLFHGRKDPTEVPIWMSAGDALVLPSIREGCPNVILEALSSGRPVVATRVGGIPELVDERNSVLVPPLDAPALAEALAGALGREWSPEALRATAARFTWENSASALYQAAVEAVGAHRARGEAGALARAEP